MDFLDKKLNYEYIDIKSIIISMNICDFSVIIEIKKKTLYLSCRMCLHSPEQWIALNQSTPVVNGVYDRDGAGAA